MNTLRRGLLTFAGASEGLRSRSIWVFSVTLSLFLLGLLLAVADIQNVTTSLRSIDPILLGISGLFLVVTNVFHAARLGLLLRDRVVSTWWTRLKITLRYGLYVALFPARLGEVAYIVRLKKDFGLRPSEGLALTVQQRLLDVVVLGAVSVLAGVGLFRQDEPRALLALMGIALFVGAILVALQLPSFLTWVAVFMKERSFGRSGRGRRLILGTLRARRWMRISRVSSSVPRLVGFTAAEWVANICAIAVAVAAVSVQLSALQLVVVAVGAVLASALPLQTVGGIGVAEMAMTGSLVTFGVGFDEAILAAVVMRGLLLGVPVLLWLFTLSPPRALRKEVS